MRLKYIILCFFFFCYNRDDNIFAEAGAAKRVAKGVPFGSNTNSVPLTPRTPNQVLYVNYLKDKGVDILFGLGPAGCGKTLFACNEAVNSLRSGLVDRIILTRPIVSVDEDLGYLPGSILKKMDPWTRPMFDILEDYYSHSQIQLMIQNGVIEISPLAYMRGRTFKRSFIIADEMQNSSPNQMLMVTTRIGENSRMVVTGDLNQSDRALDNGLAVMISKIRDYEGVYGTDTNIRYVELGSEDIQRSVAVSNILKIYDFDLKKKDTLLSMNKLTSDSESDIKTQNALKIAGQWDVFDNDAALIPKSWMNK